MLLEELFQEIEAQHYYELCLDPTEIDQFETTCGYRLPDDIKAFYKRYKTVRLFLRDYGDYNYRFPPISEIHRTRIDIYGLDTDEWGPSNWFSICDVMDGNYIGIDLASGKGEQFHYIDCFHETFAQPNYSPIVALSFTELLHKALQHSDNLYFLAPGFQSYGDAVATKTA